MLSKFLLGWRKAKALSVLQNAYNMPLKEPLDGLTDTDLKIVTRTAYDTGGNAFDAAAAFMSLRVKSAYEANVRIGHKVSGDEEDAGSFALGLTRTRTFMKYHQVYMKSVREITALQKAVRERDKSQEGDVDPFELSSIASLSRETVEASLSDPRPSITQAEVFARLRAHHARG